MKSPIPILLALAVGGAMIFAGQKKQANPAEDEMPTSLDYDDPELHDALEDADCEDEDE